MQVLVDAWATTAAFTAAGGLALRRYMLKPGLGTWCSAPPPVQGVLSLAAMAMALVAVSILCGAHATPREAMAYSAVAIMAVVMVANLHVHGRQDGEGRA
jgi:peptidoglycan/LPS O-acetylase OafA/YrhL